MRKREKKREEGDQENNTFSPCKLEAPFLGKHSLKLFPLQASVCDIFPTETSFCLAFGDPQKILLYY